MGERERRDSQRVLDGKPISDIKSFSLKEFLLYPYRAWKNRQRAKELSNKIIGFPADSERNYPASTPEEDAFFDHIFSQEYKDKYNNEKENENGTPNDQHRG